MIELLNEYQKTLEYTKLALKRREKLIKNPNAKWAFENNLSVYYDTAHVGDSAALPNDIKILKAAIRNLEFTIEWLENGRMPGLRRGIERRSVYQKEILVDSNTLKKHIENQQDIYFQDEQTNDETIEYLELLTQEKLSILTEQEKDIYLMAINGMTTNEIAEHLDMKYNTVYKVIDRCYKKIKIDNEQRNVIQSLDWD